MSDAPWDEEVDEARLRDMEREWAAVAEGGADYYAVLNVPRNATGEQVHNAYRRLSLLFHPDRHHEAEKREWAQRQFHSINRAHEVLSDPRSRAAYDQLGEEGVRLSGTVGYKVQTARDLHDAFEREARMRRIEEIEGWVRSKSNITVRFDAAKAVSPAIRSALRTTGAGLPARTAVDVDSMLMKHSFAADLTRSLSCTVSGQMFTNYKAGRGNVVGTLKYAPGSQSWVSLSAPALPPYVVTFKSMHQPSLASFCSTKVVQLTPDLATPPSATVTLGRLFFGSTTGILAMRTGNQYALGPFWASSPTRVPLNGAAKTPARRLPREASGVTLGLTGNHGGNGSFYTDVTAGIQQSHVTAKYTRRLGAHFSITGGVAVAAVGAPMPGGLHYRLDSDDDYGAGAGAASLGAAPSGLQGIGDVAVSIEMLAEVDSWTKLEWKVDLSVASGVTVTVSIHRLGHEISLPILLTSQPELAVAVWAGALPAAAAFGLHYGLLKPRRRRLIQQRMRELEEEQSHHLSQQRRHAEEAVRLMAASVEHSRAVARAASGLVVESALYGDLPFSIAAQNTNAVRAAVDEIRAARAALAEADKPRACDVTLALHALAANDQLVIAAGGSKHSLPGFYDPAFGVAKSLYVRYRFRGRLHETLVRDSEALAIPMRSHCIEP
ncbi:hypothetical protein LPJ61_000719 [Coemansia biformis]|uniref:J domain-containing protein n=1 Tax=Coemansia biformis TaxID=1286918 RepID=A0A9W7YBA0_9FUNG|nr:hypothetical protein LPJ61_000719 [Coemansia biformis]